MKIGLTYWSILLANLWLMISYLVEDKTSIIFAVMWLIFSIFAFWTENKGTDLDFKLKMAKRTLEQAKFEVIVDLLEKIAGKRKRK